MKRTMLSGLEKKNFEMEWNGKSIGLFFLNNKNGAEISVTNYGAKIVSLRVPDRIGEKIDIVLGKRTILDYLNNQEPYLGAICGRVANRIANGKFVLNNKEYHLAINDAPNSLHGGNKGFHAVCWDAHLLNDQMLELTYFSKDGEEGFPGNLQVKVIYKLTDDNVLEIIYSAETDKETIINLTNHSYFNLSGEGNLSIDNHGLKIHADTFLPTNEVSIPFGEPENVEGTPFDFLSLHAIGERVKEKHKQLIQADGYDHNFIIRREVDSKGLVYAARAISPTSGIVMDVYTTEPGIQLYTGNHLDGSFIGKNNHRYPKRSAFCLETQHYPDSIHFPKYPSIVLYPEEKFFSRTEYHFSSESVEKMMHGRDI